MSQHITKGAKAEEWSKAFARQYGILNATSFSLEKVVTLLDQQLQYKLVLAKPYVRKEFALANEWIESIAAGKKVLAPIEEKSKLAVKLLDLCVATDVLLRLKDNKGNEQLIAVDVASNPNSEQGKLDTIRGKRDAKDTPGFNRNQNIGQVRQALGITKHLILVINPDNPPESEQLINAIYAFGNQPAKTGALNLHQSLTREAVANVDSSSKQSNQAASLSPEQLKILSVIERLSEKELINTVKRVQAYFANKPKKPPTSTEKLALQQEEDKLQSQISCLWQGKESQITFLESMQKNPLKAWSKKYDKAFNELQQTMQVIDKIDAQKGRIHHQLQVWAKQTETYQAWVNEPQTKQMHQVAQVLKHPSVQQRIEQVKQQLQQKQTQLDTRRQQSPRRDRGQDLGL